MKFKNLGRYRTGGTETNMTLGIPLPKTPNGRVYRYSPNENAHPRHFVLGPTDPHFTIADDLRQRMKLEPRSNQTVCPYSGVIADDGDFTHLDDVKAALKVVEHEAIADVEEELSRIFDGIGGLNNGFIKITTKVSRTPKPKPRFSRGDLLRDLVCDHCSRDYGVFAIALFCPDCGAPNLRLHFARERYLVGKQVDLAEAQGPGSEELAYRLLGNAHEDVLTAFEATMKAVYLHAASRDGVLHQAKPVRNDFQNVEAGRRRFAEVGLDPFAGIDESEMATLLLNIQKRHVIGHNLGVMDAKFADHAEDAKLGETLHLVGEDVRVFADLCQQVIDGLDTWLGGSPAPTSEKRSPAAPVPGQERDRTVATSKAKMDLGLSPLAEEVGCWLAQQNQDGMLDPLPGRSIREAFAVHAETLLAEAIAELEADGFISTSPTLVDAFHYVRPTLDLFASFDPNAYGTDPNADAKVLITAVLEGGEGIDVAALHAKSDWTARRFNPALAILVSQIDERHVSGASDGRYPTMSFFVNAADRVALKRFAQR